MISTQQDGATEKIRHSNDAERVVNQILLALKEMKTAWRTSFKTQAEVDGYREQLLIACVENNIKQQEQINQGLAAARKDPSDFLPSIGKFVQWCIDDGAHWEHKAFDKIAADTDRMLALPKPERNKEIGRKHLEEFKKKLGV